MPILPQKLIDRAAARKLPGTYPFARGFVDIEQERAEREAMKLSKLIDYLERVLEREGDIPVVNKDGKPFTFVDVEQLDGKPLYKVVTK